MDLIAEEEFDLSTDEAKVGVRLYAPCQTDKGGEWACVFEIDAPIEVRREIHGVTSLQALCLALKTLSACLYGSETYRAGELGIDGEFGGNLSIPATHWLHHVAPYPF